MHLFLFCVLFLSSQISTALTVGVETTDYAPYFYLDEEKNYQGAARDIIDLFSQTQPLDVRYHPMPVPRLFNEFAKERVDFKFPDHPLWSKSLKTKAKVHYSLPVLAVKESLVILKPNEKQAAELKPIKLVASILGFSTPGIDENLANNEFKLIHIKTIEQLIHMLVSKRVDAIYFNADVSLEVAKHLYPDQTLVPHPKYSIFEYAYHLSSIKHPQVIQQFDDFLISHAEQVAKIRQRYGLR